MKVRFGIIGADPRLRPNFVLQNFERDKGELVAVCDINPASFDALRETYPEMSGVRTYVDYHAFLADPELEAVFIVAPDAFHEEMAVAALDAGKHVYLEKPLALTVEGCDRILEAAYRNGKKLMIGHNLRYTGFVTKMKEIIDSGIIGEIQAVWCRHFICYGSCYFRHDYAEQKKCNGLLLQKGSHDIDVIHWLAGGYTKRVVAMGQLSVYNRTTGRLKPGEQPDRTISFSNACWPPLEVKGLNPHIDVEDHSMLLMQLDNGVQASYEQCMYAPDNERNYTFIGTRGRVENIGDYHGDAYIHVWTQRGFRHSPDIIYHIKPREGTHGGADPRIVHAFFDFIRDGKVPDVSPVAARNAVAAGVMGHYSMRHGNVPAEIPPLREEIIRYFEESQSVKP